MAEGGSVSGDEGGPRVAPALRAGGGGGGGGGGGLMGSIDETAAGRNEAAWDAILTTARPARPPTVAAVPAAAAAGGDAEAAAGGGGGEDGGYEGGGGEGGGAEGDGGAGGAGGSSARPWSAEELKLLLDIMFPLVAQGVPISTAVRQAAPQLGRTVSSTMQRWYKFLAAGGKKSVAAAQRAALAHPGGLPHPLLPAVPAFTPRTLPLPPPPPRVTRPPPQPPAGGHVVVTRRAAALANPPPPGSVPPGVAALAALEPEQAGRWPGTGSSPGRAASAVPPARAAVRSAFLALDPAMAASAIAGAPAWSAHELDTLAGLMMDRMECGVSVEAAAEEVAGLMQRTPEDTAAKWHSLTPAVTAALAAPPPNPHPPVVSPAATGYAAAAAAGRRTADAGGVAGGGASGAAAAARPAGGGGGGGGGGEIGRPDKHGADWTPATVDAMIDAMTRHLKDVDRVGDAVALAAKELGRTELSVYARWRTAVAAGAALDTAPGASSKRARQSRTKAGATPLGGGRWRGRVGGGGSGCGSRGGGGSSSSSGGEWRGCCWRCWRRRRRCRRWRRRGRRGGHCVRAGRVGTPGGCAAGGLQPPGGRWRGGGRRGWR